MAYAAFAETEESVIMFALMVHSVRARELRMRKGGQKTIIFETKKVPTNDVEEKSNASQREDRKDNEKSLTFTQFYWTMIMQI